MVLGSDSQLEDSALIAGDRRYWVWAAQVWYLGAVGVMVAVVWRLFLSNLLPFSAMLVPSGILVGLAVVASAIYLSQRLANEQYLVTPESVYRRRRGDASWVRLIETSRILRVEAGLPSRWMSWENSSSVRMTDVDQQSILIGPVEDSARWARVVADAATAKGRSVELAIAPSVSIPAGLRYRLANRREARSRTE